MAYSSGALQELRNLVETRVPRGGSILDIGSQDITGATLEDLRPLVDMLHPERGDSVLADRFKPGDVWKVAQLFKGSAYRYASLDLYSGESIIQADLNTYVVPHKIRGTFDLVANLGSTEHILDQVNTFRCLHDFAKVGALFWHSVPAIGYYNHSLYNYHPLFFVFLARANGYVIESAALSNPHLEYTIPSSQGLQGTDAWIALNQFSGILSLRIRKTMDRPFQLFSDYDQAVMGRHREEDNWTEMMANRYDLRVRSSNPPDKPTETFPPSRIAHTARSGGSLQPDQGISVTLHRSDLDNFAFVYTMGKVASTAIVRSLEAANVTCRHLQWLCPDTQAFFDKLGNTEPNNFDHVLNRLNVQRSYRALRDTEYASLIKVVTVVRSPIEQLLSHYFHAVRVFERRLRKQDKQSTAANFCENILENVDYYMSNPDWSMAGLIDEIREGNASPVLFSWIVYNNLTWFARELEPFFAIQLLDGEMTDGYQLSGNVLVLKYEDLQNQGQNAIAAYAQRPDFRLLRDNVGADRYLGGVYREVACTIKFPEAFVDRLCSSKYISHFYSEIERGRMREKWIG